MAKANAQVTVTSGSPETATATIANGASLSDSVFVDGRLSGIITPAAWTAAAITFQASVDGSSFFDVYDDALETTAVERTIASGNVGTSRFLALSLVDWTAVTYVKVRSGTTGTPVNQGAQRVLTLVLAG
jgi:hypothetical protein